MINLQNIDMVIDTLKAVSHPVRMLIIQFIERNKITHVNRIYNTLKLEQSITSQHLKVLRSLDLVEAKRAGKNIYYSLNYEKLQKITSLIDKWEIA